MVTKLSQSGKGNANIGAAPVVPGPNPGPAFQVADRGAGDTDNSVSRWLLPPFDEAFYGGKNVTLCVRSADQQPDGTNPLDALTDQQVADEPEATIDVDQTMFGTVVDVPIDNDLPPEAVTENFVAILKVEDAEAEEGDSTPENDGQQ